MMIHPYYLLKLAERNPDMQEFFDALRDKYLEGKEAPDGFYPKKIGPFPQDLRDKVLHMRNPKYDTSAPPNFVITESGTNHIIQRRLIDQGQPIEEVESIIEKLQNGPITYGTSMDSKKQGNVSDIIWSEESYKDEKKRLPFGAISPLGTDVSLYTVYCTRPNKIKNQRKSGRITNVTPPLKNTNE